MRHIPPSRQTRECGGFTLIEVMVSALLLGILVAGATSVIGTGRTLEGAGSYRAQAVRIAANSMERATHHYAAYPLPPGRFPSNPNLATETGAACAANQIDSIYPIQSEHWTEADGGNPVDVPYQAICVKLFWSCGGQPDSVVLRKRIANVK